MHRGWPVALVVLALARVAGADQPIRGVSLRIVAGDVRSARVVGRERPATATLAGDPVANGALLSVVALGRDATRETLVLPPGAGAKREPGWRVRQGPRPGDGSFTWRDPRGLRGPVRLLRLSRGRKGFRVDVRLMATAAHPLELRPPSPGTGGELVVTIPGGDTWCVGFGGAAGGRVAKDGTTRFRMVETERAACDLAAPEPSVPSFESDPVRPLAVSADGGRLFAANAPDGRLEILAVGAGGTLTPEASVPVGLEPVAIAVRSDAEVWVVNELSDSISVVDVASAPPRVIRTIPTCDEPRDLVFAGPGAGRAFVTTARRGQTCIGADGAPVDPKLTTPGTPRALVQVFDVAAATSTPVAVVELFGDTPRALAASPDGQTVYAAVFRSGNRTTAVNEQLVCDNGQFAGACEVEGTTVPGGLPAPSPIACDGEPQPETGLIVRFDPVAGMWTDELGRDWNDAVRFSLPDRDVFTIDAAASPPAAVGPGFSGVGTVLFAMTTNPSTGALYVANPEANNATRFEGSRAGSCAGSSVRGRLHEARVTVIGGDAVTPRHLNKHLEPYLSAPSPTGKARSLATPSSLATDGTTLWVAAFGSGKVGAFDVATLEDDTFVPSASDHVAVTGGGPSGLVLRDGKLFVATRFDDGVSVIDTATRSETAHVRLHDPEPAAVVQGRRFLYDATATSDNGEASCSSCHVFGDLDGLAWDLGNPDVRTEGNPNPFELDLGTDLRFRALKGPMTTQSLRGMANHGPMHWRGDRTGGNSGGDPLDERAAFHAFNPAFVGLIGRATEIADADMDAFTDFALALRYPPNPIRALDDSLTDAEERGRSLYFDVISDGARSCNGCHVLAPAQGFFGSDGDSTFENEPQVFKVAHLRNLYQKVGMFGMAKVPGIRRGDTTSLGDQVRGFGFLHDGSIDTIEHFLSATVFSISVQEVADVEAFVLGFDAGLAPAVGQQVTITGPDDGADRVALLLGRAEAPVPRCDVVVHGVFDGAARGWLRLASGAFASERAAEPPITDATLRAQAAVAGQALTWTCVPPGTGRRLGIDRDADGCLDGDDPSPADASVGCN
jgi:YVTN family beta-propeller protein